MKKWTTLGVAALMTLSMATAYAAVPSKTTTDISRVVSVSTASDAQGWTVEVIEDKEPVVEEITKIYDAVVVQKQAPIEYFPEENQEEVALLLEDLDVKTLEMNEFVTIDEVNYDEQYGDAEVIFEFTTMYEQGQRIVVLVGYYTGERDENGQYIVEWVTFEAEALEDGTVKVIFTQEQLVRLKEAPAAAMAVLSEPTQK